MNKKVTSSSLFSLCHLEGKLCAPDEPAQEEKPSPDFVLCKDEQGNATATYGSDLWDFESYKLSATLPCKIYFTGIFEGDDNEVTRSLISEFKWLLYCLIYFSGRGKTGRLNADTIRSYSQEIKKALKYCYSMKDNELVGVLTLQQLLDNKIYLSDFVRKNNHAISFNKRVSALLGHCASIGEKKLGYHVVTKNGLDFGSTDSEQHVVIPTDIYLGLINQYDSLLDQFDGHHRQTRLFIEKFSDEYYGLTHKTQSNKGVAGKKKRTSDMREALNDHNLDSVFSGVFKVEDRRSLKSALYAIQLLCKNVIDLYTGMRDQELMRLTCDCIYQEKITSDVSTQDTDIIDEGRVINLISTSTKFTGTKEKESWLAPDIVIRAVDLAREISLGLFKLTGRTAIKSEIPLFVSPDNIVSSKRNNKITKLKNNRGHLPDIIITEKDYRELKLSDPERDFDKEDEYSIGKRWPLKSHQFRRSLAYYASANGVSLMSLKKQFGHITKEMTRYYRNGFENIKTIFGSWDEERGEFVLPDSHIAYEFQTGISMNDAHMIMSEFIDTEGQTFGGTGSFMERQSQNIVNGTITIMEIREDTEKRVVAGELAHKSTLSGSCLKVGDCDHYMLGDFTACFSCPDAIIKEKNVDILIAEDEAEISHYKEGTGEYMEVHARLNALYDFKRKMERQKEKNTVVA